MVANCARFAVSRGATTKTAVNALDFSEKEAAFQKLRPHPGGRPAGRSDLSDRSASMWWDPHLGYARFVRGRQAVTGLQVSIAQDRSSSLNQISCQGRAKSSPPVPIEKCPTLVSPSAGF